MNCYRSTSPRFGTVDSLFSGAGAEDYPGRWNQKGTKAVYSSLNVAVAATERAFHSLVKPITEYNIEVTSRPGRFPKSFHDQVVRQTFPFGKVKLNIAGKLIDLTEVATLNHWLSKAGLPKKSVADARFSYYAKSHLWTRALGTYMAEAGHTGIIVPSARSDLGNNVVLFDENLIRDSYEILEICELELSAISAASKDDREVRHGERALDRKVRFGSQYEKGTAEILMIGL